MMGLQEERNRVRREASTCSGKVGCLKYFSFISLQYRGHSILALLSSKLFYLDYRSLFFSPE